MTQHLDLAAWSCPVPLRDHPNVVMGHGGGGALSSELVTHLFLPAYGDDDGVLAQLGDAAVVPSGGDRIAMSTDSFVVRPRFFPGGNIGDLAVNGTVNDVAMAGGRPLFLSAAMVLEEGLPLAELGLIARAMGEAAQRAGVRIVTGDTKVVDSGHGDGVFVTTTGIGVVPESRDLGPHRVRPGDAVLVSGPIGMHGMAVMSVREGLEFGSEIRSDCAPLNGLVERLLEAVPDVHMLRDPTRGGVAASLNEIARSSQTGIEIVERSVPVPDDVRAACGFLGLDPLYVANEGKLVAFVAQADADAALDALRGHELGSGAERIGTVVAEHAGVVVARTAIGGTRVVALPLAEQLPRIC
ncbi:MAG TPA: hydrogenase expression/formation protein HypE [Candidatus Nanopelagicales bacterium]|nr:hydrogenase expression/formation protein HypE [Candidatus Nanopelagicales bacterium]